MGSRAESRIAQITSVGTFTDGKGRPVQKGKAASSPGAGTITSLARYQLSIAVSAPGEEAALPFWTGLQCLLHAGITERGDILAGGALGGILDQALLEDQGMGRVDDHEALDPVRMAQRREPGDGAAPIVADQGEASDLERVGERDQVLDDPVRPVVLDVLRLVRSAEAALVRADDEMIRGQRGRDLAPGAVRFGEAVQEDDRLPAPRPAGGDVEGDAGGQLDPARGERHG